MENNIELFDRYIDLSLTEAEMQEFKRRLRDDRQFALDFRIYLFALNGICQEAEQENLEFGHAMKNLSTEELMHAIGRDSRQPRRLRWTPSRERLTWAASLAAVLIIGIMACLHIRQAGMARLDDNIVAYNYIPDSNRGWESITADDIPSLEQALASAPADDVQAQEEAGMRLAMAYLKLHDRKKARKLLEEMTLRFADDEEFVAQCQLILNQLK